MDLTKPPQTPALPIFKLPPVFETALPNGLSVLLIEDRRFPMVTARLGFQAGSKYDPAPLAGSLSEAAAALLTEGTESRTARQIAEETATLGGALHASSTPDHLLLAASALSENLPPLLNLVADVARNASFPQEEIDLYKRNRAQELLSQRADAGFQADEEFAELLFAPHPYSRQDPTLETIGRLGRASLAAFRDRSLAPNNAVLLLLGALPPRDRVLELIAAEFGAWQPRELPPPPPARFPEPRRSIVLVDRPGSVQADIRIGRLAVPRDDPSYFPLLVGNAILGGGTSSRLFANIREKKGYAYDAHSAAHPLQESGSFAVVTQVRNEVLAAAIQALLGEMGRIGAQPVTAEELDTATNYLSGVFVIRLETQDGLASQVAAVKLMGLPLDYLEQYTSRVRAVSPAGILAAAAGYMDPQRASIVVVGDASKILAGIESFGKVEVEEAK